MLSNQYHTLRHTDQSRDYKSHRLYSVLYTADYSLHRTSFLCMLFINELYLYLVAYYCNLKSCYFKAISNVNDLVLMTTKERSLYSVNTLFCIFHVLPFKFYISFDDDKTLK